MSDLRATPPPVVCSELARYHWGFIAAAVVIVEGHLLKNIDCKLMRQIKRVPSAARMVLTGTPLQNNLTELWALLNFVLPDLLGDVSAFQSWSSYRHLGCRVRRCGETRTSLEVVPSLVLEGASRRRMGWGRHS